MKRLIIHPIVHEHLCVILKVPIGFPKFAMESPRLMLENKSHLYNAMNWD